MKHRLIPFVFAIFFLIGCTNRDGEIIDLINSVKKQNDDLKAQITALKKTTDSALVAVLKVNSLQSATDKKIDLIQVDLKSLLTQISSLTMTEHQPLTFEEVMQLRCLRYFRTTEEKWIC